jgi:hypothetical protein
MWGESGNTSNGATTATSCGVGTMPRKPTNARVCECGETCFAYTSFVWIAVVDKEDSWLLEQYKWSATGISLDGHWYAKSRRYAEETGKSNQLHRAVTGHKWEMVDHANNWGHDCRKSNLREANSITNNRNRRRRISVGANGSRFKGVSRSLKKWKALISIDGQRVYLGTFSDEVSAACAYNLAAIEHHGEFASLNQIGPIECEPPTIFEGMAVGLIRRA